MQKKLKNTGTTVNYVLRAMQTYGTSGNVVPEEEIDGFTIESTVCLYQEDDHERICVFKSSNK